MRQVAKEEVAKLWHQKKSKWKKLRLKLNVKDLKD